MKGSGRVLRAGGMKPSTSGPGRMFKGRSEYATMTAMNPDKDIIIDILKKLSLFSELNYTAIKELTFCLPKTHVPSGETIFEENDHGQIAAW